MARGNSLLSVGPQKRQRLPREAPGALRRMHKNQAVTLSRHNFSSFFQLLTRSLSGTHPPARPLAHPPALPPNKSCCSPPGERGQRDLRLPGHPLPHHPQEGCAGQVPGQVARQGGGAKGGVRAGAAGRMRKEPVAEPLSLPLLNGALPWQLLSLAGGAARLLHFFLWSATAAGGRARLTLGSFGGRTGCWAPRLPSTLTSLQILSYLHCAAVFCLPMIAFCNGLRH